MSDKLSIEEIEQRANAARQPDHIRNNVHYDGGLELVSRSIEFYPPGKTPTGYGAICETNNYPNDEPQGRQANLDLAFLFSARTDVLALIAAIRSYQARESEAMAVLAPSMPENGLVDACRQVKQVAISEANNSNTIERRYQALEEAIRGFVKRLRAPHPLESTKDLWFGELADELSRLLDAEPEGETK